LIARIVIGLQMGLDRMREAAVAGEAPDEGGEPCPAPQRPDLRQDPSTPPGPSGDRVRPPIHGSAGRASPGIDPDAIRAGRSGGAIRLGREQIVVIDDDLGRSGASVEDRLGFQRLVAEVGLGNVGLVLGIEMSRLARSCRDWHQLLEIFALFDTLIAGADGVYDPAPIVCCRA
jgi:hypothetical protein